MPYMYVPPHNPSNFRDAPYYPLALLPGLPVFDLLQYANVEGEGLGDLVTCGDVRYRHKGGRAGARP